MTNNQSYDEHALLSRIAEGDEKAFTVLFDLYLGKLKPFVEKLSPSPADAREIVQETFIRLWLNRDKLPQVTNIGGYIFRIAANQYHMAVRRALLQDKTLDGFKTTIHHSANPTERTVRLNELQRLINEAVQRLPEKRRQIFRLSRNEGMTIAEIARALGLSPKTVKNTLFTALANIREYLAAAGELGLCWLIFCLAA
ncbi:RNA polymerase sigma factor [Chitinophaga cymbidii]|uniref:DNA-directed RNA polymerase sigma-70 factor n=1 Tax=Chitinophaga cymbidii TaxID=1096750 RepID=A0A512RTA0_9BACT|nr:RNA polymerase sigma-70 factor [Chitinophaga cymbidii]GEP98904.1 DNA-directed RNA polymerase sigma-70 factor [Chitinophaga cymbidii]